MLVGVSDGVFIAVIVGGIVLAWFLLRRRHTPTAGKGEDDTL
jgi:hypothetical protein